MPDKIPPIVCLLFKRVGDSLLATPAIRAIAKRNPEIPLYVIAEHSAARVFLGNPYIRSVIESPPSVNVFHLSGLLRSQGKPSVTVDFHSDPKTAIASFLSRASTRIGFRHFGRTGFYTITAAMQNPDKPMYSARHKLELAKLAGAQSDGDSLDFQLTPDDVVAAEQFLQALPLSGKRIVALNIHSRRDYKRWPLENFAALINLILESKDTSVLLLSSSSEAEDTRQFLQQLRQPEVHLAVARDIGMMAALLKRCDVYAGNDGGAKHLATAMGLPTVSVFRFDPPPYWTPEDRSRHVFFDDRTAGSVHVRDVARAIQTFCS